MPAPDTPLIRPGEQVATRLRYSREDIVAFARLSGDANPLHHDLLAAQRANFGEIIASGQHTASRMMGLVATHFSRRDDGVPREMLCLNFNFAFKAPVFAEQDIAVVWRVAEVEASARRGGFIGHLDGEARVGGRACVVGRGTVLVKRAASSTA
ncbi:MAG: MaoC family dehydratase [Rubrivivax sp.]|nr:MaoC family dehydratase [Rubrivivax sp.]